MNFCQDDYEFSYFQFLPQPFKTGVLETNCWKALLTNVQHAMDFAKNGKTNLSSLLFVNAS